MIKEYGIDSFVATVRKIFVTMEEAINHETRFLQRIDAKNNDKWLNRHNGGKYFRGVPFHSNESKEKMSKNTKGKKKSSETRKLMAGAAVIREEKRRESGWKMPRLAVEKAIDTRQQRIESGDINPYSRERNKKMAKSKTGTKRHYLSDGSFKMIKIQVDQ